MQEYLPLLPAIILIANVCIFIRIPYVTELFVAPYRLLLTFLRSAHIIRSDVHWSVVYDAKTKLPIDPAYIIVKNPLGVEVASMITDLNGRFALLLPRGLYIIEVQKTNYIFPSQLLNGAHTDGKYTGLYYGETLQVLDDERSVAVAIPMDSVGTDWNQAEKKRTGTFFYFGNEANYKGAEIFYIVVGIVITALLYKNAPNYYFLLLWMYTVVAFGIFLCWVFETRHYSHSVVIDKKTKQPLAFARVTIFRASGDIQIMRKTTSFEGQFTALLSPGRYYLKIESRDDHGVYTPVFTSHSFRIRDGYIGKEFLV